MATTMVDPAEQRPAPPSKTAAPVAYIMSRFPKLTETFILYEILAAEQQGAQVEIYPLRREPTSHMHREAEAMVARAHFTTWLSLPILLANLRMFCGAPLAYLGALATIVWANLGSARYLVGGVLYFPKAVYMARDMQRRGVRHVHAHFCSHPAAAAFVIGRLTGIPYSFTAHGSDLHCDRHMLREKVAEAEFVAAISDYNRDLILAECGEEWAGKVHVVHCGVDTSQFTRRDAATSFERGEGPLSIVCIGTLHEVKGQLYLLEACRELKSQGIDFRCHLIGKGPDQAMLNERCLQFGLTEEVKFHGAQTRAQVLDHLAAADALVAPSVPTQNGQREGIPVVLMEAMASGVPCVGSQLSGIPELLRDHCGLLTPPRDSAAIAAALGRLCAEPRLREELANNGRRRVEEEFDLAKNAQQLLALFAR